MNSPHSSNRTLKVLVLGGSGNVGKEFIKAALAKGYMVRSLTTNLKKAPKFDEGKVEWHEGSVLDEAVVNKAVEGQDVIISVLESNGTEKTTLYSESARLVVNAMKIYNVRKYIGITSEVTSSEANWLTQKFAKSSLKNSTADCEVMKRMFREMEDDDIDWTIVQPFPFNGKPLSRLYRVGTENFQPPLKPTTSKADLVDFLVKAAAESKWEKQIVRIGM